ncbi:MAG: bifunctional DNA-formamidopyrimidine glycosylase/DNA-(apurinic or apyrimidinic site) lyase [Candidatus Eisenbacteria bacterium]|nr:bifunctional DNA-formamidopyrimidine glycosylase/DNA-(apurinic or apyrimidinic site) lyase [Candidatus Eisenbacteria bacterium]
MPELPEVETVRRMLADHIPGRRIANANVSRHRLRSETLAGLPHRLEGRAFAAPRRTGKFLFLDLDDGHTLLSHLGMSGRWLFAAASEDSLDAEMPHVHLRLEFADRSRLWYQDIRRFGMLRIVPLARLSDDPSVRLLGPDPLEHPPTPGSLLDAAHRSRVAVKTFLLDQRKLAGIGNIYASEILHRSRVDPRRPAGAVTPEEWSRIAPEITRVLGDAVSRMGTTFSTYRTIWNEPGQYGDQLLVYDRAGQPCRSCGAPVRRFVQAGRATFWCPDCQRRAATARKRPKA